MLLVLQSCSQVSLPSRVADHLSGFGRLFSSYRPRFPSRFLAYSLLCFPATFSVADFPVSGTSSLPRKEHIPPLEGKSFEELGLEYSRGRISVLDLVRRCPCDPPLPGYLASPPFSHELPDVDVLSLGSDWADALEEIDADSAQSVPACE